MTLQSGCMEAPASQARLEVSIQCAAGAGHGADSGSDSLSAAAASNLTRVFMASSFGAGAELQAARTRAGQQDGPSGAACWNSRVYVRPYM